MATNKISEQEQRTLFINSYNEHEINLYCEVPVFCRSVDLVKHNINDQSISAVEFKTTNWRRAIEQVLEVSISFDFLEICVIEPKTEKTKNNIIKSCSHFGIGLYFFNQETLIFSHIVESQRVNNAWDLQKMQVIRIIGEDKENGKQSVKAS